MKLEVVWLPRMPCFSSHVMQLFIDIRCIPLFAREARVRGRQFIYLTIMFLNIFGIILSFYITYPAIIFTKYVMLLYIFMYMC